MGASAGVYPSSGSVRITAVVLRSTQTVRRIAWHFLGYAGGLLAGSNAAIYDATGTCLAQVGDMVRESKVPGVHNAGGATVAAALTSSVTLAPGIYYIAWWFRYDTTAMDGPMMLVAESSAGAPPGRFGLTNTVRYGVISSAPGLPNALNPTAFTDGPNRFWAGLA
ncbi:hypothetical protein ABZ419_09690 [Streptomyces cinnamoneus]|uniref:hypothetical protein n=1 Tax=Streptomyces cinnamoneus TaxID=53446 RepID=UPI003410B774